MNYRTFHDPYSSKLLTCKCENKTFCICSRKVLKPKRRIVFWIFFALYVITLPHAIAVPIKYDFDVFNPIVAATIIFFGSLSIPTTILFVSWQIFIAKPHLGIACEECDTFVCYDKKITRLDPTFIPRGLDY